MGRILFFVLLAAAVLFWFKGRKARAQAQFDAQMAKKTRKRAVNMVRCSQCGVHFAQEDGIERDGKIYCSNACAQAARR